MKKKLIWITTIIVGVLLFGYIAYTFFFQKDNAGQEQTQKGNDFNLAYTYKGNNLWEYSVNGSLPTPCYAVNTTADVAESYPEQVTIKVTIQEQPTDGVCSAVIQDYSYSGTFQASGEATVHFTVE